MALSATCKKCGREMTPGSVCPYCGGKLTPPHAFWRVTHVPVRSWISWNAPMRLFLPTAGIILLVLVAAEAAGGGADALTAFLSGPVPRFLLWLILAVVLVTGLVLLFQGRETYEVAADKNGVTIRVLLSDPTALRLLAHFRSPRLLEDRRLRMEYGLLLEERRLSWKDVSRVQLWPEAGLVLLYAPRWWMREAVPCDRDGWQEMTALLTDRLGKSKHVQIPESLRPAREAARSRSGKRGAAPQARRSEEDDSRLLADIRAMNAELERSDARDSQDSQENG